MLRKEERLSGASSRKLQNVRPPGMWLIRNVRKRGDLKTAGVGRQLSIHEKCMDLDCPPAFVSLIELASLTQAVARGLDPMEAIRRLRKGSKRNFLYTLSTHSDHILNAMTKSGFSYVFLLHKSWNLTVIRGFAEAKHTSIRKKRDSMPGGSLAPKWLGNTAQRGLTAVTQALLEDINTRVTPALPRQHVHTAGRRILRAAVCNSFSEHPGRLGQGSGTAGHLHLISSQLETLSGGRVTSFTIHVLSLTSGSFRKGLDCQPLGSRTSRGKDATDEPVSESNWSPGQKWQDASSDMGPKQKLEKVYNSNIANAQEEKYG
ncbi:hypothetical protein MG293_019312 [Ovis ammon polii]|uniref:Uncharacterized protein n=1 Tax=Ovis ammon polii TaxID=230172 RepID=A0AAD4TME5_OVIAM|nr:hypothetical protein MG293_019312 [Ovis ammon polii]